MMIRKFKLGISLIYLEENTLTCVSDFNSLESMILQQAIQAMLLNQRPLIPVVVLDRDINMVIMDYLINEGYPLAAKKFAAEANIQPAVDIDSIQERVEIRSAIHRGDIQTAIENINELNPQVSQWKLLFACYPYIFFATIRQFFHAPLIYPSGC
jgi:hypothetical protein